MLPPDSCSSPPLSSLQGASDIKDHHVLKLSPPPSYHFNFQSSIHLEGTLREHSSTCLKSIVSNGSPTSKSSAELIMEINSLEAEIVHLEGYLLSLYRTAFAQNLPALLENCGIDLQCEVGSKLQTISDQSCQTDMQKGGCEGHGFAGPDDQSHAATLEASRRGTFYKISKKAAAYGGDEQSQDRNSAAGCCSLADHLLVDSCIHSPPPHRLSEDIVRCISSIYCKLADPTHTGFSSSSSTSSSNMFSPRNLSNSCSSDKPIYHSQLKCVKEDTGPYAAMIQVLQISSVDYASFNYATTMLKTFRLLVRRLEKVDPRNMAREEKLAFWINIHNALVMHAHLAYGTHMCIKGTSIAKAMYNVGGHCIDAYVVQNSILGIRSHHSAPWLQTLMSPVKKFKVGSARHAYSIEYPEPLVHFALCLRAFSDPAVRVYTAKNVYQNLEIAREEYIQGSVYIDRGRKLYLPKMLYYFAKDTSLTVHHLLEMVGACLSAIEQKEAVKRCMSKDRPHKYIYWSPQSSTFRYVIHGDVVANNGGISYV